jgi:serine-type D-Ala-D-Ala carboxypeptidase/endopeptidase (penicillin-binding protein 4)
MNRSLFFLLCFLGLAPSFQIPQMAMGAEKNRIEELIQKSKISKENLGIYIFSKTMAPEPWFELNPAKLMNPASASKLITSAAILSQHKPGFRMVTKIGTNSEFQNGIIKGDIFFKGVADPSITGAELWTLANRIRQAGVQSIEGNLILDDSFFSTTKISGKPLFGRTLEPSLGSISFAENSIEFSVFPSGTDGEPPIIISNNLNDYLKIENNAKTVTGKTASDLEVVQSIEKNGTQEKFVFSGKININDLRIKLERKILQPTIWTGYAIKAALKQHGIQLTGNIVKGTAPKEYKRVLATHNSLPIEDLVVKMNKQSNNFYADMLTASLAPPDSTSVSLDMGLKQILKFFQSLNLPDTSLKLNSPSGLSRENRISARTAAHFLKHIQMDPLYSVEFLRSLSISNSDGTLRDRFQESVSGHKIRAKTGFLNGVVSLVGYAWVEKTGFVPFALLYNGAKSEEAAKALFEEIAVSLVQN